MNTLPNWFTNISVETNKFINKSEKFIKLNYANQNKNKNIKKSKETSRT